MVEKYMKNLCKTEIFNHKSIKMLNKTKLNVRMYP